MAEKKGKHGDGFRRHPLVLNPPGRNPLAEPPKDDRRERGLRKRVRKPRRR